jgi:4-amino-4-deoxy-L-arabinose transferase-like glycosyltransferase
VTGQMRAGAQAKVIGPRRPKWLSSAIIVAAAFWLFCLATQILSGANRGGFISFADEPAHFVGAVMLRDWLASGRWFEPLRFAENYYNHYPYFAVGYWPPLFNIVTGVWLLIAGVGRQQALIVSAAFTAATGWLIFRFVRQRAGDLVGACAGLLYMSLPSVQHCLNAVMVDPMTTFLCLATAACLLRYIEKPIFGNGAAVAICSACAILSKYSAAYTVLLPLSAVLVLRRFDLLKKWGFQAQPLIVALFVGPWGMWTRKLAFYGLPQSATPASLGRIMRSGSVLAATLRMFPAWLAVLLVAGVVALLIRPRAWRNDVVVLTLLAVGHLGFLALSPVGADSRYVMVIAAALIVISFAGWAEALAWISGPRQWKPVGAVLATAVTLFLVLPQFARLQRAPADPALDVITSILQDPSRSGQRLVVPSSAEGPTIAQFVGHSPNRPDHYLVRPTKMLAHQDWFGGNYFPLFNSPEEMLEYFRQHRVDLILWKEIPPESMAPHERTMQEMLQRYPSTWRTAAQFDRLQPSASRWVIYEYASPVAAIK